MIKNVLNKLGTIRVAFVASVGFPLFIATGAYAQNPAAPPTGEAVAERVIVTGSNIPTAEEQASIPVTTYTAEWLQKAGSNTPVEGLRQLPTFVGNAATENDSNGGDGTANINLRGVGAVDTLVLINGRRAALGNGFPDVNLIPISAVQKVDILKDGASAIYGSDAVAGVVNFEFFDDVHDYAAPYEGAEMQVLYGTTTDHDANVRQGWIRGGVTGLDGKVAIFASAEYYNRAAIMSRDRTISATGDLSNNPLLELNPNIGITALGLGGLNNNSPTFAGALTSNTLGNLVLTDLTNNAPTPASYRHFNGSLDPARFNFRAFTPAIPAMEKSLEYVTGRYKIFGDALQLYADMMYTHERQKNGLAGAPFALFAGPPSQGGDSVELSKFNPFGNDLALVRYRLQQELGDRISTFEKDYWRWVVGGKGDFDFADNSFISHFGYDAGITYERFEEEEIDSGDAVRTKIGNEVLAGNFDPFIGQNAPPIGVAPTYMIDPVTGAAIPTGTAPYDNVAAAQRSSYLGHSFFRNKTFQADVTLNFHLLPNLWNGGIDVAGGYVHVWRQDQQIGDPVQAAGDQLGFNAVPNAKFDQEVNSYFGEIKIPFVTSTMNVPFVNLFEIDYAYRFEKFDDTDLTNPGAHLSGSFDNGGTNRVTVGYRPIPDLLLRGTWGESFRSPRPADLFFPTFQDFPVVFDPCGTCPTAGTLQPQRGVWIRGNPQLKPEETTNWTAGGVYSPKFVPGLTVTADWYQIYTTNLILTGDQFAQVLLTNGVIDPDGFGNGSGTVGAVGGTGLGITRDSAGGLLAIDTEPGNAGIRFVQGLDVQASYQLPTTNFGQFTTTVGWNHFFTWKAQPGPGAPFTTFLGNYNNGTLPLAPGAIPENKGFVRFEWEHKLGPGNLDFVAQGNYIGAYNDDASFIAKNLPIGPINPPNEQRAFTYNRRVTDYETLDLQLSYEFVRPPMEAPGPGYAKEGKDFKSGSKEPVAGVVDNGSIWQRMLWGVKGTAGVVNAFDRQPPTVLGAFNDNYDTSLYSIRDRFWYLSLSKKF